MKRLDPIARANPDYIDELYQRYLQDPESVDEPWSWVFAGVEFARRRDLGRHEAAVPAAAAAATGEEPRLVGVYDLVHSYRELGHLVAQLDPLGHNAGSHPLLRIEEFGFTEADLETVVGTASFVGGDAKATLRQLIDDLRATYCGTIGVEYTHTSEKAQRDWLQNEMEPRRNRADLDNAARRLLLRELIAAEGFERYLHTKYVGQKRFSLEGGETLVPMLNELVRQGARQGVHEVVLGMPHRGRLNVLANVMQKPKEMILAEFEGVFFPADILGAGDVKYHLGYSHDCVVPGGGKVHLSMSYNPSHLEIINPIVEGMVRAKQERYRDSERSHVVPLLIHGDAAFAGQGIVFETLMLSGLSGYATGGTIHVITNNQVGFTTSPEEGRSTRYASDLAQVIRAPIFHVNGDDPEACIQAARLAIGFRQAFKHDVVIDLICYRRHGHNELDDPTFTQPKMYHEIKAKESVATLYERRLIDAGTIGPEDGNVMREEFVQQMDESHEQARQYMPKEEVHAFGGMWQGLHWAGEDWSATTRVGAERLQQIADALPRLPKDFTPHQRMPKMLDQMREQVSDGTAINWGMGETLAYGSLLLEGTPVRLSGQDCGRGTFSHRHAILYDAETGEPHVPLNHVVDGQAQFEVLNSPLNEAGVLGFEYGMASADPHRLVIWEAQFGDFANGAQVVIDQFIAAGESKWHRAAGLVLLLPHGYEGQGPEHSSARPERFLQLCAEDNMQVVNLTTPAQLFHALRRQIHRSFRKPLVVMSPKSLLRHKRCVSTLADFSDHDFRTVLPDPVDPQPDQVRRVLLCSGKIYYTLEEAREQRESFDVAVVRVEQLYPFPFAELRAQLGRYPDDAEVFWVQEEPWNMGSWQYVMPRLNTLLGERRRARYVGRPEAASPATGNYKIHRSEEDELVAAALKKPERRAPESPVRAVPKASKG